MAALPRYVRFVLLSCVACSVAAAPSAGADRLEKGRTLARLGRISEAEPELRGAIALDPASAAAHSALGSALRASRRASEAVGEFRHVLRQHPSHLPTTMQLGFAQVLVAGPQIPGRAAAA